MDYDLYFDDEAFDIFNDILGYEQNNFENQNDNDDDYFSYDQNLPFNDSKDYTKDIKDTNQIEINKIGKKKYTKKNVILSKGAKDFKSDYYLIFANEHIKINKPMIKKIHTIIKDNL